jgi:Tfp pilus assembly protein PilN
VGIDLKKEIKLSDLFKRSSKQATPEPELAGDVEATVASDEASASEPKKHVSLFKRRPKEPKAATEKAEALDTTVGDAGIEEQPKRRSRLKRERQPKAERPTEGGAVAPAIPIMRAFNLLPKEDSRHAAHRRPTTAKLILVAVGLVSLVALGGMYMITGAQVSDKRATRDDLGSQLQSLRLEQQRRAEAAGKETDPALLQEQQARTAALSTALGKRVAWDRFLRDLSLVLPDDVWLQALQAAPPAPTDPAAGVVTAAGSTLTFTGATHAQDGVARFLSRLETLPELSRVTLLSSALVPLGTKEVVQFSITAVVKPPVGAAT